MVRKIINFIKRMGRIYAEDTMYNVIKSGKYTKCCPIILPSGFMLEVDAITKSDFDFSVYHTLPVGVMIIIEV